MDTAAISNNGEWAKMLHRHTVSTAVGNFSALGACIFAGAFSLGLEEAGFDVLGHLEFPDLKLGIETSRQRWPVAVAMPDAHINALMPDMRGVDFFYANPPCVAYAGTGKHQGTLDTRMCHLRRCTYELAFALEPKVWAWELVPGIFAKDLAFLEAMAFRAGTNGYKCYAFLTSSAIHGGFQDRRRFHFVASKFELDWEAVYAAEPRDRRGWRSLGQAIELAKGADGPSISGNGAINGLMPFVPPGWHVRDVPASLMRQHYRPSGQEWKDDGGVPGFAHIRGVGNLPSPNVLGGPTIVHPTEDRYLSPREAATVMGFPTWWKLPASHSKAYQEVGRGLCTHNAAFLGQVVMDGLKRAAPVEADGLLHVVDWRNRADRVSFKLPREEVAKWFSARHGFVPAELSGG